MKEIVMFILGFNKNPISSTLNSFLSRGMYCTECASFKNIDADPHTELLNFTAISGISIKAYQIAEIKKYLALVNSESTLGSFTLSKDALLISLSASLANVNNNVTCRELEVFIEDLHSYFLAIAKPAQFVSWDRVTADEMIDKLKLEPFTK